MFAELIRLGTDILNTYSSMWSWLFTPITVESGEGFLGTWLWLGQSMQGIYDDLTGMEPAVDFLSYGSSLTITPVSCLVTGVMALMTYRIVKWILDIVL